MSDSYSRLYHRFSQEFPSIYKDDRAFATWVRLLLLADASWPMRPPLPRSVKDGPLKALLDAGLLEVDGDEYVMRGLDAERQRRRDAARTGAAKRWQSERNANASADAMPRRDETRRDKVTPPPHEGKRENGTNPRALGTNPRAIGTSPRQEREAQKRGPTALHQILSRVAAGEVE